MTQYKAKPKTQSNNIKQTIMNTKDFYFAVEVKGPSNFKLDSRSFNGSTYYDVQTSAYLVFGCRNKDNDNKYEKIYFSYPSLFQVKSKFLMLAELLNDKEDIYITQKIDDVEALVIADSYKKKGHKLKSSAGNEMAFVPAVFTDVDGYDYPGVRAIVSKNSATTILPYDFVMSMISVINDLNLLTISQQLFHMGMMESFRTFVLRYESKKDLTEEEV